MGHHASDIVVWIQDVFPCVRPHRVYGHLALDRPGEERLRRVVDQSRASDERERRHQARSPGGSRRGDERIVVARSRLTRRARLIASWRQLSPWRESEALALPRRQVPWPTLPTSESSSGLENVATAIRRLKSAAATTASRRAAWEIDAAGGRLRPVRGTDAAARLLREEDPFVVLRVPVVDAQRGALALTRDTDDAALCGY